MFESVVTKYLDETKGKDWSILGILEFARSNLSPKLSVATINDFKQDLYTILRSYEKKCNVHVHTRNKATKVLSMYNSSFSTAEVKQFIKDLEYHEEARLNVTSTYTVTVLKDQQENQKLIDQLRETGNKPDDDIFQPTVSTGQKRKSLPEQSNQDLEEEVDIDFSETSTANPQTLDVDNESMIELERRANETIKRLLPSNELEEVWKLVMDRMSEKNIKVQAIESRIIDLTNWSSVEWSRILNTEDKAKLFRTCQQKLLKDQIDENVIHLIDNTSLKNLNDLKQLKDKLSNIGSEDGNLSAEIISFFHKCYRREVNILSLPTRERDYILRIMSPILTDLLEEHDSGRFQTYWIEKESKAVLTRKRRKIHAEYVKFGHESTKLDVIIELRNYGIELVTGEVGITQKDHDDLKFREDHTALKIELKDMIDNFYDVLHFKKKDLAEIFVMGIQATEVATLIVPKTMSAVESLLGPFIKNLLGFRYTLLMLNTKITRMAIARQSTPSPPSSPPHQTSETPKIDRVKNDIFTIFDDIYQD